MLQPRKILFIAIIALVILLGVGLMGIAVVCDYTPADRTGSLAAFMNGPGTYAPDALINAAQTDMQRQLGVKGQALPGSTLATYHCEGDNCLIQRLTFSLAINPRCPLPRDTVTAVDYDFQLDHDRLDVSSRAVVAALDQMVSHWQESPTTIERALEVMFANVLPDFRAAYPAFSISLNAVSD